MHNLQCGHRPHNRTQWAAEWRPMLYTLLTRTSQPRRAVTIHLRKKERNIKGSNMNSMVVMQSYVQISQCKLQ